MNDKYEIEYAPEWGYGFAQSTLHDGNGNIIVTPECSKCSLPKNLVIGKEALGFLCPKGCE